MQRQWAAGGDGGIDPMSGARVVIVMSSSSEDEPDNDDDRDEQCAADTAALVCGGASVAQRAPPARVARDGQDEAPAGTSGSARGTSVLEAQLEAVRHTRGLVSERAEAWLAARRCCHQQRLAELQHRQTHALAAESAAVAWLERAQVRPSPTTLSSCAALALLTLLANAGSLYRGGKST